VLPTSPVAYLGLDSSFKEHLWEKEDEAVPLTV